MASHDTPYNFIEISSDSDDDDNSDALIAQSQALQSSIQPTIDDLVQQDNTSDSDEFVDIDVLITQSQAQSQPPTSSNHPIRTRKPTAKQASQNRRVIEKRSDWLSCQRSQRQQIQRNWMSLSCLFVALNRYVNRPDFERLLTTRCTCRLVSNALQSLPPLLSSILHRTTSDSLTLYVQSHI